MVWYVGEYEGRPLSFEPYEVIKDCNSSDIRKLLNRLADYEDSDMKPIQIRKIANFFRQFGKAYNCLFAHVVDFVCKYAKAAQEAQLNGGSFINVPATKMVPGDGGVFAWNGEELVAYVDLTAVVSAHLSEKGEAKCQL